MRQIIQSTPHTFTFTMVQSANHVLALTGATGSMVVIHSKAGASFTYCPATPVEIATGWYRIPGTTTVTDTVGDLSWHVTANSGDDRDWIDQIIPGVTVATIIETVKADVTNQIWATATRTLTQGAYDQLTNQIWATPVRVITGGGGTATIDTAAQTAIASVVWDRPRGSHNIADSFGHLVQTHGVTVATLNNGVITAQSIASNAIVATKIASAALTFEKFDTGAITSTVLANGAITAAKFAAGAISASVLEADTYEAIRVEVVNSVWATPTRTITGGVLSQSAYDQLVNQTWATPTRTVSDKTGYALTAAAATAIADSVLDRDLAAGIDSGSTTFRTLRQAVRFLRNKWSISGTTLTVTKEDDATTSWTSVLATAATADPVTGSDPAGP